MLQEEIILQLKNFISTCKELCNINLDLDRLKHQHNSKSDLNDFEELIEQNQIEPLK